jgi:predicted nucleic acid-binding protein
MRSDERFLLDTAYVVALLNPRDRYHAPARALMPRVQVAQQVWVTEAVLFEVGAAFSANGRQAASSFIRSCYSTGSMQVVSIDTLLLMRALDLYEARPDKEWSLTDCTSFLIMEEHGIRSALTADHHFVQAGYRALLLEPVL